MVQLLPTTSIVFFFFFFGGWGGDKYLQLLKLKLTLTLAANHGVLTFMQPSGSPSHIYYAIFLQHLAAGPCR